MSISLVSFTEAYRAGGFMGTGVRSQRASYERGKAWRHARRNAKERADLVIAYQHNHVFDKPFGIIMAEELPERVTPPDWVKKWRHAKVDAGADINVIHGASLLREVEIVYHGLASSCAGFATPGQS